MTNDSRGLVLFAHGARDPRWAAPFEVVARQLRDAAPGLAVRAAYLELMPPTLTEAVADLVAAGAAGVDIVPMFLGAGGHVRQDLPRLVDALRATHAHVHFRLHPPIGEMPSVTRAMAEAIATTVTTTTEPPP